jgi:hypothetical protein
MSTSILVGPGSPAPPPSSIEDWLRDRFAAAAWDDPWSVKRYSACRVLKENGMSCFIWNEDALAYYGVKTIVFSLYLVVSNVHKARQVLIKEGWLEPPPFFKGPYIDIEEETSYLLAPESAESFPGKPALESGNCSHVVALQSAADWNINLPDVSSHSYCYPQHFDCCSFIPTLSVLLDSLIDKWLDCPENLSAFHSHLSVLLAYLYRYVPIMKLTAFAESLKKEHRQYHFDVLSGINTGTIIFRAHSRMIRDSIRKGEYTLCDCSVDKDDERFFTGKAEARLLSLLHSFREV